jgi:hypothetical protein
MAIKPGRTITILDVKSGCDLCGRVEARAVSHEFELRRERGAESGRAIWRRSRPATRALDRVEQPQVQEPPLQLLGWL